MIRLTSGEVLRQVGVALNQHKPDTLVELPQIVSWSEGIQKATAAIQGTQGDVFLVNPRTRRQKEIWCQMALENVRGDKEAPQPSEKKPGLRIRTSYDMSTLPYPGMPSKEVQKKLKEEFLKENRQSPSNHTAPYIINNRAGLLDNVLPLVQAHIRVCPIDDEFESSEILPEANMIWDTGAHRTIISADLLSEPFRRRLENEENDIYRSESGTAVQVTILVALSNTTVTIEAIALVCPRNLMPNGYNGIVFGQSQCINSLVYTSIPRTALLHSGEDVAEDAWGDLSLSSYFDPFGDAHAF
ncbi:conserved hypothetical protein [Histoplasma capsulatum G186AR]|uniref:Peptidase A2 domain-containing protein n=2 Tax=Ajellomyces capsulatus TaxID=5037 RepID=C0NZ86_AJECG|nr:uncharacterized protein HCBG_08466 [Histoplasma capsulatum G186AR]EEH03134.1 conserved hypothetical protein [Histoplasma capsulatum G186AR]KAG5290462.1 hypothetical protein I7I52_07488 [Histoplasma capsulatum]QSS72390.1 hypothetical protein I7I50_00219 [Histoplasma capsulatum G186AR]